MLNWAGPPKKEPAEPPVLPRIPGYAVWKGKVLLHARWQGTYSAARNQGFPWHVVARSPERLIEAVNGGIRG